MSADRTAVVNGVWAPGESLESRARCHAKESQVPSPSPTTVATAGARSCRENGMTLPGHLAGRRAERGERGAVDP